MKKECIYCGNKSGNTRDHVVPKSLFPKPKPNNLITVPCCSMCNKSFKKDEDLFRAWMLFGDAGIKREGKKLWEQKLNRTYKKDAGLKKIIARSFKYVDILTNSGIYLGKRMAIQIDQHRIDNVLKKIVRGLFWEEYKDRIPNDSKIEIIRISKNDERIDEAIRITQSATKFWENIFEYRHTRLKQDTYESFLIMSFYRELYYIAIIDQKAIN